MREEMGSHENSEKKEETWSMLTFVSGWQSYIKEYQLHLLSGGVPLLCHQVPPG